MAVVDQRVDLEESIGWMRAAGEPTRLRLLWLINQIDLTVSDLMEIVDQSQPRLSRHLKLLVDAGLAERHQEGAWAYFRTVDRGPVRTFLDCVLSPLKQDGDVLSQDVRSLDAIRAERSEKAANYFAANAEDWNTIRALHISEEAVEAAMLELGLASQPSTLLDLGTGTGRILQLFAPHVERALGIDSSRDMLSIARAALAEQAHVQIRQGDVYQLGLGEAFDLVILHQVLHFLEDPALALEQAAPRLAEDGVLMVVDFAPHTVEMLRDRHAHRRLGVSGQQMKGWAAQAGLKVVDERMLRPAADATEPLTVAVWLLRHQ